ncbi:ABC transporter ATP-binding protein [Desulfococcaceae bacterium HSG8]|nr:ABC transporter ATP-binding protein [Desulfococcaceae bacterium HSG8]
MNKKLLKVNHLSVRFHTPEGVARAVDGVSFEIKPCQTLALVGESGCGKSITSLSIMGLLPVSGRIHAGRILFDGQNLPDSDSEEMRRIRGRDISMIFQEPMTSLNPVLTIGRQVAEPLMIHNNFSKAEAYSKALIWLNRVRIPDAEKRMNDYPHRLSGGMRQRVMIAMAMVCQPRLLIADEPTTALDVTIQAQILSLMVSLKEKLNMSVLLITHDLGVVAQMAEKVVVMYAGQVVEEAGVTDLFERPFHPYTQGLLKSAPRFGTLRSARTGRLSEIPGTVPRLTRIITGCKFAERCPSSFSLCRERPGIFEVREGQYVRCWLGDA